MAMQCDTGDAQVIQSNDLSMPQSQDISSQINEIDNWRRAQDALYRLFTNHDSKELNQFMLGLIASENTGMKPGLLRRLYYNHLEHRCKTFLDQLEQKILQSDLTINTPTHRTVCHCMLLVATIIEPEFLSYIVLHTHNREGLRVFLNNVLNKELRNLLQGGFDRNKGNLMQACTPTPNLAHEIFMFVNNSRHMYALHCMPKYIRHTEQVCSPLTSKLP